MGSYCAINSARSAVAVVESSAKSIVERSGRDIFVQGLAEHLVAEGRVKFRRRAQVDGAAQHVDVAIGAEIQAQDGAEDGEAPNAVGAPAWGDDVYLYRTCRTGVECLQGRSRRTVCAWRRERMRFLFERHWVSV